MSRINISGIQYEGNNITVKGSKVIINGKDVTPDTKIVNITVEGNVEDISVDYCEKIVINGNVKSLTTTSGDVECKDITGGIRLTSGDVECGNVNGDIQTVSGDVKCENVSGNVKTMSGDIKYRK